jgi:putative endonuclease
MFDAYTKSRRPVTLAFSEHFERITDAIAFERQIKGWSRAKKEALIRRDRGGLQSLARCRTR